MTAEIVSVGTEILLGDIVDTNAAALGKAFARAGILHVRRQTVGDNLERLRDVLKDALSRSDLVVTIGGLGPTVDDLTRDGIAAALDSTLIEDAAVLAHLKARVLRRNHPWVESMARQAMRPDCAEIIANDFGSAPGLLCRKDGKTIIAMPGPKSEFNGMLEGPVAAILQDMSGGAQTIVSKTLRIVGLGESMVEERVKDLLDGENPTVAPYAKTFEVHLRMTARGRDEAEARQKIQPVERALRLRLGDHIYGVDDETLPGLVVHLLRGQERTIAIGESCTGGLLCGAISEVEGASRVLLGGVVAYSIQAKVSQLGVRPQAIEQHTVYSVETAIEMAKGACEVFKADWGVGITGVAGPDADEGVRAGSVWIALAGHETIVSEFHLFPGEREAVRRRSVSAALNLVRRTLQAES